MPEILSNRLKLVIQELISDNQTTFIAGRQIMDGFLIANEIVHDLQTNGKIGMIFKVDFHKAFDTVLGDYLVEVMGYMDFGGKWRRSIHKCLSTTKLSILVNGSPSVEFQISKGIR